MKDVLQYLSVDMLIVHDVPKKLSKKQLKINPALEAEDIILSEAPTDFDQDLTQFFHDKIVQTIGSSNAFGIQFESSAQTNVQTSVLNFFGSGLQKGFPVSEKSSISITQDIALHLHAVQTAQNTGGILLFIPCHARNQHALAILKVEREEGVRIQRDQNTSGQTTFNVQHIKDLMLTKKTKLFKIVLFYLNGNAEVIGYLCDQQQGYFQTREVADFFLKDFLGCKLIEEPSITTKKFFDTTEQFINEAGLSADVKTQIHTHLISEHTNNNTGINILEFARRSLPADIVQSYMNKLIQNNVSQSFVKDNQLIKGRIKKVQYEFESGIKIIGEQQVVNEKLTLSNTDDGKTRIEFTDALTKVVSR